ncbi:hypothetical protein D3C79_690040 [compost metagenome]
MPAHRWAVGARRGRHHRLSGVQPPAEHRDHLRHAQEIGGAARQRRGAQEAGGLHRRYRSAAGIPRRLHHGVSRPARWPWPRLRHVRPRRCGCAARAPGTGLVRPRAGGAAAPHLGSGGGAHRQIWRPDVGRARQGLSLRVQPRLLRRAVGGVAAGEGGLRPRQPHQPRQNLYTLWQRRRAGVGRRPQARQVRPPDPDCGADKLHPRHGLQRQRPLLHLRDRLPHVSLGQDKPRPPPLSQGAGRADARMAAPAGGAGLRPARARGGPAKRRFVYQGHHRQDAQHPGPRSRPV